MIVRDLAGAERREHDVVVVGGGIYGVAVLREAARRGMSACLCEAGDFGGGVSWNSLRIVHGGLRYLQSLDLRRFYQSVAARRRFALQFPRLVRRLDCLMPLYRQGMKRKSVMRAALKLNDVLSSHRNRGLELAAHLPAGRVLDALQTRSMFPLVRGPSLEGAATWCDYFMVSSERILVELLHDACEQGALALNYLPVEDLLTDGQTVRGVVVRDRLTGQTRTVASHAVVNCAGSKVRQLAAGRGGPVDSLFRPSLAFNILLERTLPTQSAVAVAAPTTGAPMLFVVPQQNTLLAGTLHLPRPRDTTEPTVTEEEIATYLEMLNAAIPDLKAEIVHVKRVFSGLLPAAADGSSELSKREIVLDHGSSGGLRNLYSVSGVKFTTADDVARQVLDRIGGRARTAAELRPLVLSGATDLLIDQSRLVAGCGDVEKLVREVVAAESVQCVDDLVLRRSNWATTEAQIDASRAIVARLTGLPASVTGDTACA